MEFPVKKYCFYAYSFFTGLLFFMPVLLNIYLNRNIEVQTIFLIEIVYSLSIFVFEIPSGVLGDRYGHGRIVCIGLIGNFLTYLCFSLAQGIIAMCIIQAMLGLFGSFISGSDKVRFFSLLKTTYDNQSVFHIQKRANVLFIAANLISFISSGYLMRIDSSGSFVMLGTALGVIGSFIVFILANRQLKLTDQPKQSQSPVIKPSFSFHSFWAHKELLSWCIVSGILLAILENYYWIIQIYYDHLDFSNETVGILFMASCLITIACSRLSLFHGKSSKGYILLLVFPISYLMMPIPSVLVVPVVVILYSIMKIELRPFLENKILELQGNHPSTNISIVSWINHFIQVFFLLIYSLIFSFLSFGYAVVLLGVIILFAVLISLKMMINSRNAEQQTS
ncbi:putative MFS-type transporter YxaM [Enterococcus florum]|uniref:Putative MFS-type transporter YxaM n=1 Tax=Enterococcus florum TaxID=2480627 RepID=A0A4V0WPP0_9ENTE|nr:MFS transporter [Enterococcus florum]GCF94529.1 putative MFS-type transporter YxaM [Enterococcus florum]